MKKKTKLTDYVQDAFIGNDELQGLFSAMKSEIRFSKLCYVSLGCKHTDIEMSEEIRRRIKFGTHAGAITGLGVIHRSTSLRICSPAPTIDTAAIRKEGSRLKKELRDVIYKAVVFPTLIENDVGFGVAMVALVLSGAASTPPRVATPGASASMALPLDEWIADPTDDDVDRVLESFRIGTQAVRRLADVAARSANADRWHTLLAEAVVQCRLIDALTPVKRAYDAAGLGSEILKHALTGPEARVKEDGKTGFTRDELSHRLWSHALATKQYAPPLVKL